MSLISPSLSRPIFRAALSIRKASPNLLFAGGVVGVVAGSVLACRATLKLPEALDNMQNEIDDVKSMEKEDARDLVYVYAKNVAHIGRLYAPAIMVGAASIGALTGSHVTLNRRNAGLTAAYAALSTAYDEYRARVSAELGEDREMDIYNAPFEKPDNVPVKEELTPAPANPNKHSPYARFFDEGSINFEKNAELNLLFVKCQQNYANHLLQARGHLFLNEVYDMLGIGRSQAGQVVGWVIGEEGDNYVDFGLYELQNSRFINGYEPAILLDFNVDGVIYDKI